MESLSKMKQCSVTSTTREHWNHHDKRARGPPRRADTTEARMARRRRHHEVGTKGRKKINWREWAELNLPCQESLDKKVSKSTKTTGGGTTKGPGWHDEGGTTKSGRGHNEEAGVSTDASELSRSCP